MKQEPRTGRMLIRMDAGTLKRFRVMCIHMGTNMSDEVRLMIEDWIVQNSRGCKIK